MNIIFICGALEPGKDGVGDYTRRLGCELKRQGHHIYAIAINDKYINKEIYEKQKDEGAEISVLRLPANWPANRRFGIAKEWITKKDPEWISLQFVPYSFHSKGLPFLIPNKLIELGRNLKWHIMFHELWNGMNDGVSLKLKILGYFQKGIIKSLLKKLEPEIINTQTRIYQWQLEKLGYSAGYLPLFSNISEKAHSINNSKDLVNQRLSLVLFGAIHPDAPIIRFVEELQKLSASINLAVILKFVGRNGPEKFVWEKIFKAKNFEVHDYGEKAPEEISEILSESSIGVSTTPFLLAEKSGSIAAMKAHGLPVICVSSSWNCTTFRNSKNQAEDIYDINETDFEYLYRKIKSRAKNVNSLTKVAHQFIYQFNEFMHIGNFSNHDDI
jgi:glycosyltransferase involved in cell wall biosynthesis